MSSDQLPAILTALATLVGAVGGAYLAIKSANRPVLAALEKNTTTLEAVDKQTNSHLTAVTEKLDAATSKADRVTELAVETLQRQLAVAESQLTAQQTEINRLNAAATPPRGGV